MVAVPRHDPEVLPPDIVSSVGIINRGLDSHMSQSHVYTSRQQLIIRTLAVVFAAVSVLAAFITFYWFVKMKRSFRHHLVIILIQSDMIKSLCYLAYPVVAFANGPVGTQTWFCQSIGFFLALSTEATDFGILILAIHACLYIFMPGIDSSRQQGIYDYRHFVYCLWIVFPILMASLAFLNHPYGYATTGAFCMLPARPFWYRLALSWIPRYVIFLVILGIYLAINIYVRIKFRDYGAASSGLSTDERSIVGLEQSDIEMESVYSGVLREPPPMPELDLHGLIPSTDEIDHSTALDYPPNLVYPARTTSIGFSGLSRDNTPAAPFDTSECLQASSEAHLRAPGITSEGYEVEPTNPLDYGSVIHILQALREQPLTPPVPVSRPAWPTARTSSTKTPRASKELGSNQLAKSHQRIQRRLRYLFVYPLLYILTWLIPFVSHCLQYMDHYIEHPPFVLICLSTISMVSQCSMDCLVFSAREKPWRYIPGSQGTFLDSFCFWTHDSSARTAGWWWRHSHDAQTQTRRAGAQMAFKRLENEQRELVRQRRMTFGSSGGGGGDVGNRAGNEKPREWWDTYGRADTFQTQGSHRRGSSLAHLM